MLKKQPENKTIWRTYFESEDTSRNMVSKTFTAMADLEAALWLHYGVEVDLISREDGEAIYLSRRRRLKSALRIVQAAHTIFDSQLEQFFANVLRGEPFFDSSYTERLDSDLLNRTVMEMLFGEIARVNSNPLLLQFSDSLTFDADRKWSTLMARKINPSKVLVGKGTRIERVCAGYFAALDHMGAMEELLQYCGDESVGKEAAARGVQGDRTYYAVSKRVRLMHLWRMRVDDRVIKRRFLTLTYKLREHFDADLELSSSGFDSGQFLQVVRVLCRNWLGDYSFSLGHQIAA